MNLDAVKNKLADLENSNKGGGGGAKYFFRPEQGSQVVRFLPSSHDPDFPFFEGRFYYDLVQNRSILSPSSFGEADPIIEFCNKLKSTGDKNDWLLSRELEPKLRTYAPVLVRGKEDEGPKMYGFGKTVYSELLSIINDPDYGDITDLKNGTDITIEFDRPSEGFPSTTIRPKRNASRVTDSAEVAKLIKETPDPRTLWTMPSYDELKIYLENFLENRSNEDAEDSETAPAVSSNDSPIEPTPTKAKTPAPAVDVDAEFDALFN